MAAVQGLEEGTRHSCCVSAVTNRGTSAQSCVSVTTREAGMFLPLGIVEFLEHKFCSKNGYQFKIGLDLFHSKNYQFYNLNTKVLSS